MSHIFKRWLMTHEPHFPKSPGKKTSERLSRGTNTKNIPQQRFSTGQAPFECRLTSHFFDT